MKSLRQNLGCHILHRSKSTIAGATSSKRLAIEGGILHSNFDNLEDPEMCQRF